MILLLLFIDWEGVGKVVSQENVDDFGKWRSDLDNEKLSEFVKKMEYISKGKDFENSLVDENWLDNEKSAVSVNAFDNEKNEDFVKKSDCKNELDLEKSDDSVNSLDIVKGKVFEKINVWEK